MKEVVVIDNDIRLDVYLKNNSDISRTKIKEMIKNGLGILAVPVEKIGEYFTILIEFYETNDYTNIKKWIYDNCIDGVE